MIPVFVDIETLPDQREGAREAIAAEISPPANYSKPETIAKWVETAKPLLVEERYRATALDAAKGQIFCIGVIAPGCVGVFGSDIETEGDMLTDFFAQLDADLTMPGRPMKPLFIGHNILGFDLPFIWRRAVINRVRPPTWFPGPASLKPWGDTVDDTMLMWAGQRGTISLDNLCRALGIETKEETGDITGATVWDAFQAERYEDICAYCMADVERTRECWKRMRFE